MKEIIHFDDNPTLWDALYISGHSAPGIVEAMRATKGFKADETAPQGVDGGSLSLKGKKLGTASVTLKLWTRNHFTKLSQLLYSIYEKKKLGEAFDMDHPILQANNLRALVVLDTDGPTMPDKDRIVRFTLSLKQWTAQPKKPKGDVSKTVAASTVSGFNESDAHLLEVLKADRRLRLLRGDPTSQLDERIWNLEQRQKAAAIGPPSKPGGNFPALPPVPGPK